LENIDKTRKVSFEAVDYTYNKDSMFEKKALENISFESVSDKVLGICGNTGSGKSTLIRLINRLLKPENGKVCFDDVDLKSLRDPMEIRKKVGIIFQYPDNQLFESSVKKELVYGPLNFGFRRREALSNARKSLNMTGLDYQKYKNRNPFSLSGGEKRKVAIASILASDPEIIIFDEPTAGLDSESREKLIELIALLKGEGRSIIVISHDSRFLDIVCDQLLVLSHGRQVFFGDKESFFSESDEEEIKGTGVEIPFEYKVFRRAEGKIKLADIRRFLRIRDV